MTMEFLAPVYIDDTVTIDAEIIEVEPRGKVRVRCRWTNAAGAEVLRGSFAGYPAEIE